VETRDPHSILRDQNYFYYYYYYYYYSSCFRGVDQLLREARVLAARWAAGAR
jgi:hypothetical protein